MEEILRKANELGLMIKGSELYRKLEELSAGIEADGASKALLEEYLTKTTLLNEKEQSGSAIEVSEKKEIEELSEKIAANDLIKDYITVQTYFMNLLIMVQKTINEPVGEPIAESKIIKPGTSGKIITGF